MGHDVGVETGVQLSRHAQYDHILISQFHVLVCMDSRLLVCFMGSGGGGRG